MRRRKPTIFRIVFAALAAVSACLAAGAAPAHAQEESDPSILIVFDASKSMRDDDGSGRRKIDAARAAVREALRDVPASARVGVRVFGATAAGASRATACRDSQLISPVGRDSPETVADRLDEITPNGRTPIGHTLREAARDLPASGDRTVILISDGGDNCSPPSPCSVAREASGEGVDFRIEAVGFQVGRRARQQLRCIARVGGGEFRGADDAGDLSRSLRQTFLRTLRTYQVEGSPVRGAQAREGATEVGPGQYTDGILPGAEQWYRIRLGQGEILRASTTLVPPLRRDLGAVGVSASLRIVAPDGRSDPGGDSEPNLFNVSGAEPETLSVLTPEIGAPPGDGPGEADRAQLFSGPGEYFVALKLTDSPRGDLARQLGPNRTIPAELRFERLGRRELALDAAAEGPGAGTRLANGAIFLVLGLFAGLFVGRRRARKRSEA